MNQLELFHPYTKKWFEEALGSPTAVQEEAWPAIAAGDHTLVSAPTGTGKTLTAFLVFIDRLKEQARKGKLPQEVQLIYISPLKALAGDIRENLKRPLDGILQQEEQAGDAEQADIDVAIRTGDTTQKERAAMLKLPPHILITTPESLYLMITSKSGRSMISSAKWIVIDELHAMIESKRGAHLMLSMARLDVLCGRPLQRIGLSATIEPLDTAAAYLSPDPVTIIKPKMKKHIEIVVSQPLSDRRVLMKDTIWQNLAKTVIEHSKQARSILVFLEGRMYAEKLAYYINETAGEGFARAHHGSLSKEQRYEVEEALRRGNLRVLCATSSMELGIDVGDIEQVLQVGCPSSISSTMQRLGRAGHSPNRTSVMYMFPKTPADGLYCGLTARVASEGGVEHTRPPRLCLDVLSQHLVSMAVSESYHVDDVMGILARAWPFREVEKEDVKHVLRMLAGDYEHERNIPVRPRILYDRIHEKVESDAYSRMLAVLTGGTIPDKGLYAAKTESGVKLGELDEEFVFESRVGDIIMLGTFSWQISGIEKNNVILRPAGGAGGRLPFWHGDPKGRKLQTGLAFGEILRELEESSYEDKLLKSLKELGMDTEIAKAARELIGRQISVTGVLANDRTIVIEHFRDENGRDQMMVHSIFGRQINGPLAILMSEAIRRHMTKNVCALEEDDGFLLFPYDDGILPEGLLTEILPEQAKGILAAALPATPVFNMAFRYNAARSLMMGVRKSERQPLWLQRMKAADMLDVLAREKDHPLMRETTRECMEDYWDVAGVEYVLHAIQAGDIRVHEIYVETPSPLSLTLRQKAEAENMYDYHPTPPGVHQAVTDALQEQEMIEPSAEHLERVSGRGREPEDEKQLHTLLMIEGDLAAGELEVPEEWMEQLLGQEQAEYMEPALLIAAEHRDLYIRALYDQNIDAMQTVVLRLLRYRGAQTAQHIAQRYLWPEQTAQNVLTILAAQKKAVETDGLYYHAELYERARRETVKNRRTQMETLPPERYSALMLKRMRITAPPAEQLERAVQILLGRNFAPDLWEKVIFPARVKNYRENLLDALLTKGETVWRIREGEGLGFYLYDEIDWETEPLGEAEPDASEQIIYDALRKRGASFIQRLTALMDGSSPYEPLMSLTEKGYVTSDSFMPVRQLGKKNKRSVSVKGRISARVKTMNSGRWEIAYPAKEPDIEEQLERAFDQHVIVCRDTVGSALWSGAYEKLTMWEYTGQVRRGYFIEGMSGIQYIRDKDFTGAMFALEHPEDEIYWISAADPAQVWGKCLPHMEGRAVQNIPGTAVALRGGVPVAAFERKGKFLRAFDREGLDEVLEAFVRDYNRRYIYPDVKRVVVKQYLPEEQDVLAAAGFMKEMQDYVLYRK